MFCLPPLCSSSSIDEDITDSSVLPSSAKHRNGDIIITDIAGDTMDEVNSSDDLIVEDIAGALNKTPNSCDVRPAKSGILNHRF